MVNYYKSGDVEDWDKYNIAWVNDTNSRVDVVNGFIEVYGDATTIPSWNALQNFITTNDMSIQANYDYVDSLLDVKSVVDYMLLNSYVVSADWLNWNTGWWRGLDPAGW